MLILLALTTLLCFLPDISSAEFHIILNEHFNRDPQQNRWPWATPGNYNWFHNVRNWNIDAPRVLGPPFTDCGWGWQDFIYSSHVLQDEDFPGSLWCAYRTRNGPDNPQWPEDDEYWNNMNAWAIWGPFSLRNAISGTVSTWFRIYLDHFAHDSLSICICWEDGQRLLDGNDFRSSTPIGYTRSTTTPDWLYIEVDFDSLYVNREQQSALGQRRCWLAYVWHSNNTDHPGTGAFIDDIILGWDDGLFDIRPLRTFIGVPAGEDSISWSLRDPMHGDTVYFKLDWECVGSGDWTPEFDIQLKIDHEVFFTQHYDSVEGNDSLIRTIETDEPWIAERGQHFITWELDTPIEEEGNVEESEEGNNVVERLIEVEWDPPPLLDILTPVINDTIFLGHPYTLEWTVSDSDTTEMYFDCYLFWSTDTSGWAENKEVIFNDTLWVNFIWGTFQRGDHFRDITWSPELVNAGAFEIDDELFVAGFAIDANQNNITYAICPGSSIIRPPLAVGDNEVGDIVGYELFRTYPNPFNRSLTIEYHLRTSLEGRLMVYDLSGRTVAKLIDGMLPAGGQTHVWQPSALPGGIYFLRLETASDVRQQKVLYMP